MQTGERADPHRPRIYDRERDEWQPQIYDVASEPDGWPNGPKREVVPADAEPHDERRSGSIRGRRAADPLVRSARPPLAIPIRLFEPDFQHLTIHQPASGSPTEVTAADQSVTDRDDEPDRPDSADLISDGDSARPHEPAARQR